MKKEDCGDNVRYWNTYIEGQEQTTEQRSEEEESGDPREYLASVEGTFDTWAHKGDYYTPNFVSKLNTFTE